MFVLIVSIGMTWLGVKMVKARRQREAVEAIEEVGGVVWYDYQGGHLFTESSVPKWARALFGDDFFFDVVAVESDSGSLGDDEASDLKALENLVHLDVSLTQITDAGLEHLEGLTKLEWLSLIDTQVTPEGVKKLKKALPECVILY